jgi:iron complex transport system ATP-binding protein
MTFHSPFHNIALEQATVGYSSRHPLLQRVNLTAEEGELITLVGRNGTGKSTLLRSILGLQPLLSGICRLRGIPLHEYDPLRRARTVSYVSSHLARTSVTVRELVSLGRIPYTGWLGRQGERDRRMIELAVREVGMEEHVDRSMERLSDGERQRVMMARAFVQDTPVMLLDEPAAYLDIPNKYELVRILSAFRDQGKTIIYSSHDLETALLCADKFWVIHGGIIHQGSPEDLGLSGLFDRIFETSGIRFDTGSGRFRYSGELHEEISLSGEPGPAVVWTTSALERAGFRLTENNGLSVTVRISERGFRWTVRRGGEEFGFENLYSLTRFLTREK